MESPWKSGLRAVIVPYHLLILTVFAGLYSAIGFRQNFNIPPGVSTITPFYFAVVAHTNTGFGDITPKTDAARMLVLAHLLLAWIPTVIVASL
jgi:Ion channel